MVKSKVKFWYFILFKLLLFLSILISIKNQILTNIIISIIIIFLLYMPKILKLRTKKKQVYKIEIILLLIIYTTIFIETTTLIKISMMWFRISLYLLMSFVIGIIGFSLIYVLNKDKRDSFNLDPFFVALFAFTFSLSIALIWEISKHILNYFFLINIQNYNPSDSLGFLTINLLGSGIVSFIGFIYLKLDEDKNFIKNTYGYLKLKSKRGKYLEKKVLKLILKGESKKLEFKETLRYNLKTKGYDKRMGHTVLKTICAFMNTKGGVLLVGVKDDGRVNGIRRDGFENSDKFSLYFNNLFKKHIGNEFVPFMNYEIVNIQDKEILKDIQLHVRKILK